MQIVRTTFSFTILLLCFYGNAQVQEDFSDGDFTSNPVWSGNESAFQINSGTLNSNNDPDNGGIGEYYLSTPSSTAYGASWEFFVDLQFSTSSANYVDVYLMSDQEDLTSNTINGYFVRCGDTDDEIVLYKITNGAEEVLIDFGDDLFNSSSSNPFKIRVTRDVNDLWALEYDDGNTGTFITGGTATDASFSTSSYFGFFIKQSSLNGAVNGHFFDDITISKPIELLSITPISNSEIEVQFDQWVKSESVTVANFAILDRSGIFLTLSANRDPSDPSLVHLNTSPLESDSYFYIFDNVSDSLLNEIVPRIEGQFLYTSLNLIDIFTLSDTELRLNFNDELNESSAAILANYSVDNGIGNPSKILLDPSDNSILTLTFASVFSEGINYQLAITNLQNQALNSEFIGTSNFNFIIPLIISSSEVLSDNELLVSFNKELDPVSGTVLSNYLVDGGIGNPSAIALQADNQSVLLTFASTFLESDYTLTVSDVEDVDENLIDNSGNAASFSYLPLEIEGVEQVDFTTIRLGFNQKLEQISAELLANYLILGANPTSASLEASDSTVLLTFPDLANNSYDLIINGIENEIKNASIESQVAIDFEKPTSFRAIIVSELMADPTISGGETIGQPNAEYVEIYNTSSSAIDIESFELNGSELTSYTLEANSYLLITSTTNYTNHFSGLANAVGQAGFDALTNSGDQVVLKDQFGNVIDSIFYDLIWYDDETKEEGGYSLELINPDQECSEDNNWTASIDLSGGTPGNQNSVFDDTPDIIAPSAITVATIDATTIQVDFSEPIDFDGVLASNFEIAEASISSYEVISLTEVQLTLSGVLVSETFYTLSFIDLQDCSGNSISPSSNDFYYDVNGPIYSSHVILSETEIAILFNEPLKESNAEDEDNFSLDGTEPDRAILQDSALHRVHLSFESSLVETFTYMLAFESLEDTLGNVSIQQQIPFTYLDQVDSAYAIAANLLAVKFEEKPSIASASAVNNYKIDDIGSPTQAVIDELDSTLVRLSFDQNFDDNKILKIYIENIKNKQTGEVLATPAIEFEYDTDAPDIESVIVESDVKIKVIWEEPINTNIASSSERYRLEDGENPISVEVTSDTVLLTFSNSFEIEFEKTIYATSIPDISGNVFSTSRSEKFIYDPKPPVLEQAIRSGETTIRLTFHEKLLKDSVFNFDNFELEGLSPLSASFQGPDSLEVTLAFASIADATASVLSFKNLVDQRGNFADDSTLELNTENPNLVRLSASSDSTLNVEFSEEMNASIEVIDNYQSSLFSIVSLNKVDDQNIELGLDGNLKNENRITITFSHLIDLDENLLQQSSSELAFQTLFVDYSFIDDKTIELEFDTKFESVSSNQFELNNEKPQISILDGEEKGIIRLLFSQDIPDNITLPLSWTDLIDTYGRRIPDFQIDVTNDGIPPELELIESGFFGVVNLTFDEELEEESAESSNLFSIVDLGNPSAINFDGESVINLDFDDQLISGQSYQLVIDQLSDISGNFLIADTTTFTYNPPAIPAPGYIIITEYMADPSPVVGLPEAEYVELYNASGQVFNLKSIAIFDDDDFIILDDYEIGVGEYVLLTSTGNFDLFDLSNKMAVSGLPTLGNSIGGVGLGSIEGDVIDLVIYDLSWYGDTDKDDGGYSLELINPESQCFGKANWTASDAILGGTPGAQNSVYSLMPDTEPPTIVSYDIISVSTLQIHFSEPMDSASLQLDFFTSEDLNVISLDVQGIYFESVEIVFDEELASGDIYTLAVNTLADCSGNVLESTSLSFGLGGAPSFNEILITEIMADPDPVVSDLPNAEFLEIFNNSDRLLSLEGISLIDASDTTELSAQMLEPGAYLILSPTSAASDFMEFGDAMGVSNWPSLSNSGEQISLLFEGNLIFSVAYDQDWHEEEKADGGYSLEMKDVSNPCGNDLVWGSAINLNGGTPGQSNSNTESVPDNFGPELVSAVVISENEIRLDFSEVLSPESTSAIDIQTIPSLSIEEASQQNLNGSSLSITFSELLVVNQLYEMTVSSVFDCNGNEIEDGTTTFARPGVADSLSIIINEVLFNPNTGGVDFVEIYNNSEEYFDLKNWSLARKDDDLLDQVREISISEKVIAPSGYLVLTSDVDALILQYPDGVLDNFHEMASFPTYANDEGTVVLLDENQNVIDQFSYLDDYHSSLLDSDDGVSLERIDFNASTQNSSNWASASSTVGFATPGYVNSQSFEVPQISGSLDIEPKVFVPGSVSLANESFTTINYQFDEAGKFANVVVYDQYGRAIQELANGASLSTSGFFRWDGTDNSGKQVRSGYYLVVFEVFDGSGNKDVLKETVVVGWE